MGLPTIFVRFAGCNLKCPGWPCDTQHAIDPKLYRNEWKQVGPSQIVEQVLQEAMATGANNVCLTGGEPFLQSAKDLHALCAELTSEGFSFEAFTNGQLEWPTWALYRINIIMDWKLTGSGDAADVDVMMRNAGRLQPKDAIKFTVISKDDMDEAEAIWHMVKTHFKPYNMPEVFCGPVWDFVTPNDVAHWIMDRKLPWRLNIQTHKYIFGDVRGI